MNQLMFWEEDETLILRHELRKQRESNEKMRKALFARHGELAKNYMDLSDRMEIIERNICRNRSGILFG